MKTTSVGRGAEKAVAEFLQDKDYKIVARNWRTRWCEIDIIAQKAKCLYFIEVKYRAHESHGSGLEYIGPNKIRQLTFAANFWVAQNGWEQDYQILGAEVAGSSLEHIQLVEI